MKQISSALRSLSLMFLVLSLLMPLSIGTAMAEETSTHEQSLVQSG